MGPTLSIATKIEIKASPAVVRSVFMSWSQYPSWQPNPNWDLRASEAGKQPLDLKEGDGLHVSMDGKAHQPIVVENSPAAFKWKGSLFGLGSGVHQFHFTPSEEDSGATTFVHGEDFEGLAITLSAPWWRGRSFDSDVGPWDKFNACLKAEAEKVAAAAPAAVGGGRAE
ncbi:SRPBCC family protein [Microdochium nivale]|nr:SRPBCC family protein [Microdochium nivale]